jgi:hypothetical protein
MGTKREVKPHPLPTLTSMFCCDHIFELDQSDGQVRCRICKVLDDEMEIANQEICENEKLEEFYKSQVNFE